MADQGPILSAVDAYADTIAAARVAAQKTADDAVLAEMQARLTAAISGVQARLDAALADDAADDKTIADLRAQVATLQPPRTLIGMSAPATQWTQRLAEVGPGVTARRIFADLAAGGRDQADLIGAAFGAGMMPVISYKVGGNYAAAITGSYDAAALQAATLIASYGKPATVTVLHEPQGDVSAPDFAAIQLRLAPIFQAAGIKVGPFLNGWLLDRQADTTFASFAPDSLLKRWDFLGIDTYEAGTLADPGAVKPADRIPALVAWAKKRGFTKPLAVGEYNGYSAATIKAAGDAILAAPQVWFGCMWNSTIGKGYTLTGDRLAAFKATLADPRTATTKEK